MSKVRFKKLFKWSPTERKLRLFRFTWNGDSTFLSFAVWPRVAYWKFDDLPNWRIVLFGLSVHYKSKCPVAK